MGLFVTCDAKIEHEYLTLAAEYKDVYQQFKDIRASAFCRCHKAHTNLQLSSSETIK